MNPLVREAIIRAYDFQNIWMEDNFAPALKREKSITEQDTFKTIQLMKDAGELVPYGSRGALRLSLKAIQSQEPIKIRLKKYMLDNRLAVISLCISGLSALTSIVAVIISLIALHRP